MQLDAVTLACLRGMRARTQRGMCRRLNGSIHIADMKELWINDARLVHSGYLYDHMSGAGK